MSEHVVPEHVVPEHVVPEHVVYVCTDPGVPVFGRKGCSVHVQAVLRQLLAGGARIDMVVARTGGEVPADLGGVRVHELGRPHGVDAADTERLHVQADRRAAELVRDLLERAREEEGSSNQLVYQRYGLWSCEVLETSRELGVPCVLEVNAPLVQEQARHRVLVDADGALERTVRALQAADLAYAVSGPVAQWASQVGGIEVPVVPNGVDVHRFPPPQPAVADTGPFVLAFVGTFRPWHGMDLLVQAVSRLAHDAPPADGTGNRPLHLLLVGDGPLREGVLASAERAGVPVTAPGAVDPADIPGLLSGADAAVAPYPGGEVYFSPLKVMEYLAAGLPTVAGAVTDLPDLLRDGEEVLLVPPGDLDALVSALRRVRDDAGLRQRLSSAGRAAARERLTWSAAVDGVLQQVRARTLLSNRAAAVVAT